MQELTAYEGNVLHPRPSPIAAAMYTLRDLEVDVIVIHGPAGCNFRAARLLERDGVIIVTTSLGQEAVIFGGEDNLIKTLQEVERRFSPSIVGVIGTCCANIIGEDMHRAVKASGLRCSTIVVDCDPYNPDNIDGAIKTLDAAVTAGIVSRKEADRQKELLCAANENERSTGTARESYLHLDEGDDVKKCAASIHEVLKSDGSMAVVLNAKKETAYLYADVLCAIKGMHLKTGSNSPLYMIGNIDSSVGLARIRGYAKSISTTFSENGVSLSHISGGLDEYAISGKRAAISVKDASDSWDMTVVCGLPHTVPLWDLHPCIAVATGTRAIFGLKKLGYDQVLNEGMAHYSVLGSKGIVPSRLGSALRELYGD